jgi:hypothetical protein
MGVAAALSDIQAIDQLQSSAFLREESVLLGEEVEKRSPAKSSTWIQALLCCYSKAPAG